jgi:hypothetical protein
MSELDRIRQQALSEQTSAARFAERNKAWTGYIQEVVADLQSASIGTIALYKVTAEEIKRPQNRLFGRNPPPIGTGKYTHTAEPWGRGWFIEQALSRHYDGNAYGLLVLEEARVVKCSAALIQQPLPGVPDMEVPSVALAGRTMEDATIVRSLESVEAKWIALATVPPAS